MTFKPSEVVLSMPPLTACFEKTEAECAAAMLVWALARSCDDWTFIPLKQIGALLGAALDAAPVPEPIASWARNPFFNPDFERLSSNGYIAKQEIAGAKGYVFTEKGLERLARWVPQKGNSRT